MSEHPVRDKVTAAFFGVLAVGAVTFAVIERGGDPVVDGLPEPRAIGQNALGYYHSIHCAEIPATPPRMDCIRKVTLDPVRAAKRRASDSFMGSWAADVAGHPASMTPRIWGNPAPE